MADAAPNPNASPAGPPGEDFTVSMPESWRAALERPTGPARRIDLMEDSLRCLAYGWLSLVPVVGAFAVLPTLRLFRRVDRERVEWNPARHLLVRGLVLACFGSWGSLLWWGLVFRWAVDNPYQDNDLINLTLAYLMLFGSLPVLLGLAFAAVRAQNAVGAFVLRHRRILSGLALVGYLVVLQSLVAIHWRVRRTGGETDWSDGVPPSFPIYWAITLAAVWGVAGFIMLCLHRAKFWWWFVWLAGVALLTRWSTTF